MSCSGFWSNGIWKWNCHSLIFVNQKIFYSLPFFLNLQSSLTIKVRSQIILMKHRPPPPTWARDRFRPTAFLGLSDMYEKLFELFIPGSFQTKLVFSEINIFWENNLKK